jgi:hypothetical protein
MKKIRSTHPSSEPGRSQPETEADDAEAKVTEAVIDIVAKKMHWTLRALWVLEQQAEDHSLARLLLNFFESIHERFGPSPRMEGVQRLLTT